MLDPVANTLDLRDPFDASRAERVLAAVASTGVEIADVAYFDDMLHEDPAIRRKKHDFMLAVMDAAVLLGAPAVCGFVGRDQSRSMDQNLIEFENDFVPLLKAAKDRGLQYRVEQCPMPGWTPGDNFHNNIGYAPGTWIALHQICERNGVADQFRIHYDPSHAILMGQDTRSIFQYLNDEGYDFLIAGMHVKGQVIDSKGVAGWGYGGQTVNRGDWVDGEVSPDPADLANSWNKQTVLCEHELPGTARHDPLAYLQNRSVDWLDHQLAARELLDIDFATTPLIVEHEYPPARVQERELLQPILAGSISFTRHIDRAAADMFALQNEVLAAQEIPVQGYGRQAYRS
jgi:sugar phosphate isomerase/epimerase